jgi:hypothetical protein
MHLAYLCSKNYNLWSSCCRENNIMAGESISTMSNLKTQHCRPHAALIETRF